MTNPRVRSIAIAIGLFALVAAVGLWWFARGSAARRGAPPFGQQDQPPPAVYVTPTPQESWSANRCTPLAAPCGPHTAGTRYMRTYPADCTSDPASLVGFKFVMNGSDGTCA